MGACVCYMNEYVPVTTLQALGCRAIGIGQPTRAATESMEPKIRLRASSYGREYVHVCVCVCVCVWCVCVHVCVWWGC